MKFFFTLFTLLTALLLQAQQNDTTGKPDLETVVIKAFEQSQKLRDVPAAVNYINRQAIDRFSPASIVQAVNTTAGVRMEERSPGSYRLNIRGSSLRSPFGVRNVKIYFNDIPFTDPDGHSFLNTLSSYQFSSIEIVKGPGSSLYGAGTGGVAFIESMNANESDHISAEYTTGSYGLRNIYAASTFGDEEAKNKIGFQHLQNEGYRTQSALERNNFSWTGRFTTSKGLLKTTFLYSQLFYKTPGALTKAEYDANPRQSRPAGGGFPSAEQNKAAINQKTALAGISYHHSFSPAFSNTSIAYGMFTDFRNPAIRNYGKNTEPHTGARTSFAYQKQYLNSFLNIIAGGELQQNFTSIAVHKNNRGEIDSLQTLDDSPVRQSLLFLQAAYELDGWELTAGSSLNYLDFSFKRSAPMPLPKQQKNFSNELAPRVSIGKKLKNITVYTSIAKGFSPPTSSELLPSGSAINLSLDAETGTNYEIGFRGLIKDLSFDITAFLFRLQNTIVQRRDAGGGELFINAGKTLQRGIETALTYPLLKNNPVFRNSSLWFSHTWHRFRYKDFKQLTVDYSGKALPGTAPHTVSTGIDIKAANGLSANINYFFSDRIPLSDANSEYAAAYHLVNAKLGFERQVKDRIAIRLSVGAENLLNKNYSLGNDLNAFGGRFYNAAPKRNFYVSLNVQFLAKQSPSL